MILNQHKTPRQLCNAVKDAIGIEGKNLVARPWNFYEPDFTNWWLVPTSEWPAYKYGKIYFQTVESSNSIRVGLHIEKGLDRNLEAVYNTPKGLRHLMQDDWLWCKLLDYSELNSLTQLFTNTSNTFRSSIELVFEAGYVDNPADFNPYSLLRKTWDRYVFSWQPSTKSFTCTQ